MATRYERNGHQYINYTTPEGERTRLSLGRISEADAKIELARVELALLEKKPLRGGGCMTFKEYVNGTYLTWHKWQFPDSHFRTETILRLHLTPEFGHMPMDRIDNKATDAWLRRRMETPLDPKVPGVFPERSTIEKELRVLNAVLNRAIVDKALTDNGAAHSRVPGANVSKPKPWYRPHELALIYAAEGNPTWRWSWQALAYTGLRRAEFRYLPKAEVYLEERRVHVLSTDVQRTKSQKWRDVPLSDHAVEAYKWLMENVPGEYVCPPVHINTLTHASERTIRRAGLKGSIHCFRHTFCSNLVRKGVPLLTVKELAGHANISTTEGYAHLAPSDKTNAVLVLNSL